MALKFNLPNPGLFFLWLRVSNDHGAVFRNWVVTVWAERCDFELITLMVGPLIGILTQWYPSELSKPSPATDRDMSNYDDLCVIENRKELLLISF